MAECHTRDDDHSHLVHVVCVARQIGMSVRKSLNSHCSVFQELFAFSVCRFANMAEEEVAADRCRTGLDELQCLDRMLCTLCCMTLLKAATSKVPDLNFGSPAFGKQRAPEVGVSGMHGRRWDRR